MLRTLTRDPMFRLGVAVVIFVGLSAVVWAGVASATDADVTYSTACANPDTGQWTGTVTAQSHWDGGIIHVHVERASSGSIDFDVPPLGTNSGTLHFQKLPETQTVTVSSSNGHLHGELTHTFIRPDGCAPTTTTTQKLPVCPPGQHYEIPGGGGCFPDTVPTVPTTVELAPPTSVVAPPETSPPVSSPPATAAPRPTPPTTVALPHSLPITGVGTVLAVVGLSIVALGLLLVLFARRSARWWS
jgi:hypothetical protein